MPHRGPPPNHLRFRNNGDHRGGTFQALLQSHLYDAQARSFNAQAAFHNAQAPRFQRGQGRGPGRGRGRGNTYGQGRGHEPPAYRDEPPVTNDPGARAGRSLALPGDAPERPSGLGRTRRRSKSPERGPERKRARVRSPDRSQPHSSLTNQPTANRTGISGTPGATNRSPVTSGSGIPRGPVGGSDGGNYAGGRHDPTISKGLGDTIRPDSRSGQPPGGDTGFVVPGDNDVAALISAYPPHVIHAYQEAWRLTQEFNNSFGFGFGTGLGAQALGPSAGIGDFSIHRQSVEDHQLRTFEDASERASVAAPPTPSTVQGDLPQGSHHRSPGGLSLPVPLEHLIIGDSEMQDAGPCSPAPNPDTGIRSAPKLVLDPIGTAKQTDKDSQLGGAEVQGAETDRKGEGKGDGKCVLDGNDGIGGGEGQGKRSGVSTESVTNSHEKDKET
ncbi:unnamed protein product [Rhizoctonia solani]|uniref:Uncharacterized protein n=1 Tax=Rhizoctonia solani TaxID=456999 RepID=A0A8H2Y2M7_9AGAM|nr:unnamed protein product [Rhizoctonia solani]